MYIRHCMQLNDYMKAIQGINFSDMSGSFNTLSRQTRGCTTAKCESKVITNLQFILAY